MHMKVYHTLVVARVLGQPGTLVGVVQPFYLLDTVDTSYHVVGMVQTRHVQGPHLDVVYVV